MNELWITFVSSLGLNQLSYFHFLRPWWLMLFFPSLLLYWLINREISGISQWQQRMSPTILNHLMIKGNTQRLFSPRKMLLPFVLLSTVVLAGPSWQQQPSPFLEDESVLVIALDLSTTMREDDLKPSRLLRAKQKINELLAARGDAKTALVAFAGSAHIAMPVTKDRQMIQHFLEVLDWQIIPIKSKDSLQLLPKVEKLTKDDETAATVLLVTDSAGSEAIEGYEKYFSTARHQLIVWSINNPSADRNQFNEEQLRLLAEKSNGDFVAFRFTDDDVLEVNYLIGTHMVTAPDSALPWWDAGYYLLFVVAAIQLLWFRKGWTLQW